MATEQARVEVRGDGDARKIVGYASVFYDGTEATEYELWRNTFERIAEGAFDAALQRGDDAAGLFNHSPDNLLARVSSGDLRLSVDARGLFYEIDVDADDPDHARVVRKIERGNLRGSSFAFVPTSITWVDEDDREIRIINEVELWDVGPVTYPAYDATTTDTRSLGLDGIREERNRWVAERDKAGWSSADAKSKRARVVEIAEMD